MGLLLSRTHGAHFHDLHSAWNTRPQSAFYTDRISNIASERSHYLKTEYNTVKTRAYFWKRKYFLLLQVNASTSSILNILNYYHENACLFLMYSQ